eukprot:2484084-Rhodomonas_salina.1
MNERLWITGSLTLLPILASEIGDPLFSTAAGFLNFVDTMKAAMMLCKYPCTVEDPKDASEEAARVVLSSITQLYYAEHGKPKF